MSIEFTLTQRDVLEVKKQSGRIRLLFPHVSFEFQNTNCESNAKKLWVTIKGLTEEICFQCKDYIMAMIDPETKVITKIPEDVQNQLLQNNGKRLREIELENKVIVDIDVLTRSVSIQGNELEVVLAKSIIDELKDKHAKSHKSNQQQDINEITCQMAKISIDNNVKNFALKLGYTENDIALAANKCIENGIRPDGDAILKELTKQNPQKTLNTETNTAAVDAALFQEEFVTKTVAEHTSEMSTSDENDLRGIVIDGSNIAMCHGHKEVFSCVGLEIVVNWFKQRGHKNIIVFVPQWRQESPKADCPIINQEILSQLEKEKILVFTPSRRINGRRVICYDDRYIVKYAVQTDSIIVSNDNFRDLQKENSSWKQYLDQHILMYSFVNDMFMPPDDPLGRLGPTLDEFLKTKPYKAKVCPYKNKCTYGAKCRYFHPDATTLESNTTNDRAGYNTSNNMNSNVKLNDYQTPKRPSMYMSCAAEMNAYEMQRQQQSYQGYDDDIVAKCPSVMHRQHNDRSMNGDWQNNQRQTNQIYPSHQPSMNYYPNQPQQPAHHQQRYYNQSPSPQPQPTSQWSGPTSQQPYNQPYHQSYPIHQQNTPNYQQNNTGNSNQYYMAMHHPSNNQSAASYQHPSSGNPPSSYQQHPSQHPRYMPEPRSMNGHYYPDTPMTHTLRPIEPRERPMAEVNYRPDQHRPTSQQIIPCAQIENTPLFQRLIELFPNYNGIVRKVLLDHPNERDLNVLVGYVINEQNR
ncbi:endoribonuclease ZC3H12A-like [Clytia hemisphaerica]|uniref:C3H1-type domain-containing protein n=1 Tax=Clytia hemisphaerica TaxID=252671 RepID=A0A7M5UY71_9CNID